MAVCAAKHHAREVGLGEAGNTTLEVGGRYQGVGKFIQGGGAGNSSLWVGDVGTFGINGEEDRGDTHGVPETNHREESEVVRRWDMGDARGGRRTRGSRNPVGWDLHIVTAGNLGAVVGSTSLI